MGFLLTATWLLSPGEAAWGESAPDNVYELGEVVVTEERPAAAEVATVTEITREDFQAWSAYTVADALAQTPGAEVGFSVGSLAGNGKQESLLRLRGFETTNVLILLDGMPLTEPYMKRVDLNQILLDNVAKITVTKGPSSVLYGPNTAGGIVNIVTQEGDAQRTILDQRFADYKTFRSLGQNRGMVGPFRYVVGGSYDRSDGFPISGDFPGTEDQQGQLRENSDYERYDVTGRVGLDLGSKASAAVAGGYYSFQGGVPFGMVDPSTLWRKNWDRWYVNGSGEWAITDSLGVKVQGYYNKFDNEVETYTDSTIEEIADDGSAISTYDNYIAGYFLNPTWNLGPASHLKGAFRYERDRIRIQNAKGDPWETYEAEIFSFGLEDEVRPLDWLSVVGGVGYNLNRKLKAFEADPGDDEEAVDFQAGLLVRPHPYVTAHISAGRKTTFPTMRELYSSVGGNANLSEQSSLNYEVGFESNLPERIPGGSVAFFRSEVDDLIGKKEEGNTFTLENVDEALIQGIELSLFWDPVDEARLLFNYTYLDTEDKRPERVVEELDFRPPHAFSIQAYYWTSFGLSVNSRYGYVSPQKYETIGGTPPEAQAAELPARGIWDIHVGQKYPFTASSDWHVEVYLDVQNVLDEYYEDDPGKAMPGRIVWGGVRAVF
ncbi:MAG: TonB-dependent receptor [bacterium]